jgi:hypothetical protein
MNLLSFTHDISRKCVFAYQADTIYNINQMCEVLIRHSQTTLHDFYCAEFA